MAVDPIAVLQAEGRAAQWYVGGVMQTLGVPPDGTLPEGHWPPSSGRMSAPPLTLSSTQTSVVAQLEQIPASP
jgi:hypothetical protein